MSPARSPRGPAGGTTIRTRPTLAAAAATAAFAATAAPASALEPWSPASGHDALADAGRSTLAALQAAEGLGAAVQGAIETLRLLHEGASKALADAIREGRDEAVAKGVRPIPPAVRARLEGTVPAAVLDRVRHRAGGGGAAEVLAGLPAVAFGIGHAHAVTLDHVVLFRDAERAGSVALWAHELVHVEQYARWGVDGFARRYVLEYRGVEQEAYDRVVGVTDGGSGGDAPRIAP